MYVECINIAILKNWSLAIVPRIWIMYSYISILYSVKINTKNFRKGCVIIQKMKIWGNWFFQKYYHSCTFCPQGYENDQHDEIYWFSSTSFSYCNKVLQECFLYCIVAICFGTALQKRKTGSLKAVSDLFPLHLFHPLM